MRRQKLLIDLFLIIFVSVLILISNGGMQVGLSNQTSYLPVVQRILDPHFLPGDFLIESRIQQHYLFHALTAGLITLFGENMTWATLGLLGPLLLAFSVHQLARTLGISRPGYVIIGSFLALSIFGLGKGFEMNSLIGEKVASPTIFAYALCLISLTALLKKQFLRAATVLALACDLHLQIGPNFALIVLPLLLSNGRDIGKKNLLKMAVLFSIFSIPAFVMILKSISNGVFSKWMYDSYVFRLNHHLVADSGTRIFFILGSWILLGFSVRRLIPRDAPSHSLFRTLVILSTTILLYSLLHALDYYIFKSTVIMKLYLPRMSVYVPLFSALCLIYLFENHAKKHTAKLVYLSTLLLILLELPSNAGFRQIQHYGWMWRQDELQEPWTEVCLWIRNHLPPDALFIAPPGIDGFTYLARRSNLVEFKAPALRGEYVKEWETRLADVTNTDYRELIRAAPQGLGSKKQYLNQKYTMLTADSLRALALKYRAKFAVLPHASVASLPVIYSNSVYKVVSLQ